MSASRPHRIVMLDRGTFPPETNLSGPKAAHDLVVYEKTSADQTAARIGDADIVITNKVRITREVLEAAPNLKMVAVAATGYDVIDVAACKERGVVVSNVRDYARNTVPEHCFALMLALRRSLIPYDRSVAAGRWLEAGQFCYFDYPISDLAGSTLGIIGDGAIGQAVGKIAEAFGMRVLYAARRGETKVPKLYTAFETVLEQSDVLTLHVPLRPENRNMIDAAEFDLMKRKPLIINTGRGGLVNEQALVDALLSGKIAGAGFDVTTTEPMPADHPFNAILGRPNFILTPHVAWASRQATQAVADQVFSNIDAFITGAPVNVVG